MNIKTAFAARLNTILDEAGYPPKHYGRQERLAKEWGVTPRSASNWLNGEKLPTYERILEIAIRYQVSADWLQTGLGLKKPLDDQERAHIEEVRELGIQEREQVYRITKVIKQTPADRAA